MSTSTMGCGRATARSSTDSSPWRAATPEGSPVRRGGGQARHRILAGARPLARLATARWARAQPVKDGIQLAVHPVEPAVDPVEPAVHPVEPAVDPVEPAVHPVEAVTVPGLRGPHVGQRGIDPLKMAVDLAEPVAVPGLGAPHIG